MMNLITKITRHLSVLLFTARVLLRRLFKDKSKVTMGFLVEEFFHEKFRGFGGYGMTIKYIAEYFNNKTTTLKADILLTHRLEIDAPQSGVFHSANVIMMPQQMKDSGSSFLKYCNIIHQKKLDLFIGVDHFPSYEFPLIAFPNMPWVIWLKDPRDEVKWAKMATVDLLKKGWHITQSDECFKYSRENRESFQKIFKRGQLFGRKVVFATEANDFTEIGKRLYSLKSLNAAFLSKPIPLPAMEGPSYSERPSFLFLARLDPIKRPWVFCELAKRFKDADFLIAGQSNMPEVMDEVMAKYKDVPNLKLLGRVFDKDKDILFRKVWAVINTSVHEGLPVSMVEGFSYGKTIIASENPDNITTRLGFWTGEMSGNGYDEKTVDLFAEHVEKIIKGQFDREALFKSGREYIRDVHSYEKFESVIRDITFTNKYDNGFELK